ncbi:hypothetical protein Bpfe_015043 [Biomphalaria pfeifferi]|uniref:Uncharacterized protein n=1 Tax=Biomphalaria pfeifferi TaxID=112525 RepID=A0AAD8F8G3_BIOPF|nr:hypothetical protein Bpfe_015043 [Biomphalaria pfeifferi]
MNILLLTLVFVASASAYIIRPLDEVYAKGEREICLPIFGVAQISADPHIRGKRDEDINLAEIVANIGKVVHVIDEFVAGTAGKREEQDVCITLFGFQVICI